MRTSESITNLATALLAAQQEMPHPKKTATNPHLRNKFADLTTVFDTVIPVLNKHGIVLQQEVSGHVEITDQGEPVQIVGVETTLIHAESGEFKTSIVQQYVPQQKGLNMSQAVGSTVTYLKRYGVSTAVVVSSEPDDDGNEGKGDHKPDPKADFEL
jgi:hypothetical protein